MTGNRIDTKAKTPKISFGNYDSQILRNLVITITKKMQLYLYY